MPKKEVTISVNDAELEANLVIPDEARGMVIFSHGSGSSRLSSRNNYVADVLNNKNIATLLTDLLSPDEDNNYQTRFNIPLLTTRLVQVTKWVQGDTQLKNLPTGYFGASTGAASALGAAAKLSNVIKAIVSRGGRPDLAMDALPLVKSSTLLIVGSLDTLVIDLNKMAYNHLKCEKRMEIIEGASHLFEEPGTLNKVARIAAVWFEQRLLMPEFFIGTHL
jgi:putative phosphoribosyl transferase